jgi:antitoxin (DNA-binding transcriptional repressor) of toxin-antitoxin stability system
MIMVMVKVNLAEAKANLSRYLATASRGESVVICNHNVPVAELRALPKPVQKQRPIGLCKGQFRVPPRFFQPAQGSF